ncbi:MAG: phosphate signaling complex protein PhoU [Synergistaceae bacterium]|jgi:phosphate transport system protein|nr:phosphate signaling complex protein PhoU [Synergistaceae bacterium]
MSTRKQEDADLAEIKRMLLRLGKMSENAVLRAVWALKNGDIPAARTVIDGDDALDELTERIDGSCMGFNARYQPLGQDLRMVVSTMHMAVDLERIGDYGVNIARATIELEKKPLIKPLIDIPQMAAILSEMLGKTLSAFDVGDFETAKTVFALDDQIDALEKQVVRELFTMVMERVDRLEQAFLLMGVARTLERAGDHATNIAERVIYMCTGKTAKASSYKGLPYEGLPYEGSPYQAASKDEETP